VSKNLWEELSSSIGESPTVPDNIVEGKTYAITENHPLNARLSLGDIVVYTGERSDRGKYLVLHAVSGLWWVDRTHLVEFQI
jgi:hypothetical protein